MRFITKHLDKCSNCYSFETVLLGPHILTSLDPVYLLHTSFLVSVRYWKPWDEMRLHDLFMTPSKRLYLKTKAAVVTCYGSDIFSM